jgi:hypothetical protein
MLGHDDPAEQLELRLCAFHAQALNVVVLDLVIVEQSEAVIAGYGQVPDVVAALIRRRVRRGGEDPEGMRRD